MYPSAPLWFAALLVLVVVGFWPSYFSPAAEPATFGQHFHSFVMLGWLGMLIVQPWLIRSRRRNIHRAIGRASFVVGPLVVFSALYVVLDNLLRLPQPYPPIGLSFFWLGLGSALYYALLFGLGIFHRKDMQRHARYMAATALGFIVPGLGRVFDRIGEATELSFFSFPVALWAPAVVGAVMIAHDFRTGARARAPWVLATAGWVVVVLGFHLLPRFAWFSSLADWYRGFA